MPNLIAADGTNLGEVGTYAESEGQFSTGRRRLRAADRCAFYVETTEQETAICAAVDSNTPLRLEFDDGRRRSVTFDDMDLQFAPGRHTMVAGDLGPWES